MAIYYVYHKITGEFAGSGETPIDNEEFASTTEPPRHSSEQKTVWDGDAWKATLGDGTVTPRQLRLALLGAGIDLASIDTMIAENPAAKVEWEYASVVDKAHPLIQQFGKALGLTDEQIDALFTAAARL